MVSSGEKEIETIVAVSMTKNRYHVLPPCGKCRELMREFGGPYVIVEIGRTLRKLKLPQLIPITTPR
jgi:cytidine deaminase